MSTETHTRLVCDLCHESHSEYASNSEEAHRLARLDGWVTVEIACEPRRGYGRRGAQETEREDWCPRCTERVRRPEGIRAIAGGER